MWKSPQTFKQSSKLTCLIYSTLLLCVTRLSSLARTPLHCLALYLYLWGHLMKWRLNVRSSSTAKVKVTSWKNNLHSLSQICLKLQKVLILSEPWQCDCSSVVFSSKYCKLPKMTKWYSFNIKIKYFLAKRHLIKDLCLVNLKESKFHQIRWQACWKLIIVVKNVSLIHPLIKQKSEFTEKIVIQNKIDPQILTL